MVHKHPLMKIIEEQKKGIPSGICSICSANELVLEAAMEKAKKEEEYVLIESTANQVNQYGGYTGMKPVDFREFVYSIAERLSFPKDKIILGGDHLGPLTWKDEPEDAAMGKAEDLVKEYLHAGFTKTHIDTSMRLGDDSVEKPLDPFVVARRGARLCLAAENAFTEYRAGAQNIIEPVYVIGSEVPIPGGGHENEEIVKVTKVKDFEQTVDAFKYAFLENKLKEAWERIIAVVVQPGVEFSDNMVHEYKRNDAKELSRALNKFTGIVFEGHSTDYQTSGCLKQMVEDGIAILKVGPALTFALREGLFMLNYMEKELIGDDDRVKVSNFIETLDSIMVQKPYNWIKYYHGDEWNKRFSRKYSMSDRCRYYLPEPEVKNSIKRLISNLENTDIPLTLISQFMPAQYKKIRKGKLLNNPKALLKDKIMTVLDDYYYAVKTY